MTDSKYQINTNIARLQSGGLGTNNEAFVLGAASGTPEEFGWEGLRYAFAANNPDKLTCFDDFNTLQSVTSKYFVTNSGTDANADVVGGNARLAGGTTNNGYSVCAPGLYWTTGNGTTYLKIRFKRGNTSNQSVEVGLASSLVGSNSRGVWFSNHRPGTVATENDAAGVAIVLGADSASSPTFYSICITNDGGNEYSVDTDVPFATTNWVTVEFIVYQNGSAKVATNGREYYFPAYGAGVLNSFTSGGTVLTPYFANRNLSTTNTNIQIDYFAIFGER